MKIEQFLTENREQLFDSIAPGKGHRFAMQCKLEKRKYRRKVTIFTITGAVAVAAAIVVAMFVISPNYEEQQEIENPVLNELSELDTYYRMRRMESVDSIEMLLVDRDIVMQREIMEQVAQIETQTDADPISDNLLTIDADKYLALTVLKYENQSDNLKILINILNQ